MNHHQKWVTRTIKTGILGLSFLSGILSAQAQSLSDGLASSLKAPLAGDHAANINSQSTASSGAKQTADRPAAASSQSAINQQLLDLPASTGVQMPAKLNLTSSRTGKLGSTSDYSYDYSPITQPGSGAPSGSLSIADNGSVDYTYPLGTLHAKAFNFPLAIYYTSSNSKANLDGIATGVSWSWAHIMGHHQGNDTDFTFYSDGGAERLKVDHNSGKVTFKDVAQSGKFSDVTITYCKEGKCPLPIEPASGLPSDYRFKLVFHRTGQVMYLGITRAEENADKAYFQRKAKGGSDYRLEYFVPLLLTNSVVDPEVSGSGSYVKFEYKYSDTHVDKGLDTFATYAKDSNDGVYGIPVLSKLISDTGAEINFNFTSQSKEDGVNVSKVLISTYDAGQLARNVTLTSEQVAKNTETDEAYPSEDQPYPNINLVSIDDDGHPLSSQWPRGEYVTNLSYQTFNNDYDKDGKHPVNQEMPVPYSYGDAILDQVRTPNGSTQTVDLPVINVTGGKDNDDNTFSALVLGMPLCETDETKKDSMGVVCRFYDKNGTDYASFFSMPIADYITDMDAQGQVKIESAHTGPQQPTINNANDLNPTLYTNPTGFPYISPLLHKQPALWELHNNTDQFETGVYGKAEDPYEYKMDQENIYTGDKGVSDYSTGPYMQTYQLETAASGLQSRTDYTYADYKSSSSANLTEQPVSFSLPTTQSTSLSNVAVDGDLSLSSTVSSHYTDYGDVAWTTGADNSQIASYYSYEDGQNDDADHPYYLSTASVSLPYLKNGTDGQSYRPDGTQAYAYYSYNKVNTERGVITDTVSGYVQCQSHDNAYNEDGNCYDYVDRSGLFSSIKTAATANRNSTWLGRTAYNYDSIGRLKETQRYVPVDGSWQASVKTSYTYVDSQDELANQGIDTSKLPASLLSSNDRYVITTITSSGNTTGNHDQQWTSAPMQKSLGVIDVQNGRLLGQFWGYDNNSSSTSYQSFVRGTVYEYDGFGIPRQTIAINQQRVSMFNYTVGSDGLDSQLADESYYCPSLTTSSSLPVDISTCQALAKTETTIDSLGRVTGSDVISYDSNGQSPKVMASTRNDYHDVAAAGHNAENEGVDGLLQTTKAYKLGQLVGTSTPIYNASHVVVGNLSQTEASTDSQDTVQVAGDAHSNKSYTLSLSDPVKNRQYQLSFAPCGAGNNPEWCAKYLAVSQYERDVSGTANSYDSKGGRLVSNTTYRYSNDESNGYDLSEEEMTLLNNSLKDPADTQALFNKIVKNINFYLDDATTNVWKVSSQSVPKYDIYNRVTQAEVSSDGKHTVSLTTYNAKGQVVRSSNASAQNLQTNGGRSNYPATADIKTVKYGYNALGQQTQVITYADNPNTPIDGSVLANIKGYHEQNLDYNALGQLQAHWLCGDTTGSPNASNGCLASNSNGTFTRREIFHDPDYDDLNRLTSSKNAMGATLTTSYDPVTGWVTKSMASGKNSKGIQEIVGTCQLYDRASGELLYLYDTDATGACQYTTASAMSSALASDASLRESLKVLSYTYYPYSHILSTMTYPDGKKSSASYDSDGVLRTTTDVSGFHTAYTYYLAGGSLLSSRRTYLTDSNAPVADQQYAYDPTNRIKEVINGDVSTGAAQSTESMSYVDGVTSNVVTDQWTLPSGSEGGSVGASTDFKQVAISDAWGLLSIQRSDDPQLRSYDYDALSRLTAEGSDQGYHYDVSGDMTSAENSTGTTTWTSGSLNELSNRASAGGNTSLYEYDANGDMLKNDKGCYSYNPVGQLVSFQVRREGDSDSCSGAVYDYSYLPDGSRWTKTGEKLDANGYYDRLTYYGGAIAWSTKSSSSSSQWVIQNMSHFASGAWFVTEKTNGPIITNGGKAAYIIAGNSGNILGTDLVNTTGSSHTLASYDGYGHLLTGNHNLLMGNSTNPFDNTLLPMAFHGQLVDLESESLFYPLRSYSLTDNRWLQADPDSGAMNPYQAWNSDGINEVDPLGADSHPKKTMKAIGSWVADQAISVFDFPGGSRDFSVDSDGQVHGSTFGGSGGGGPWWSHMPVGASVYGWQQMASIQGDPAQKAYLAMGASLSTAMDAWMMIDIFIRVGGPVATRISGAGSSAAISSEMEMAEFGNEPLISSQRINLQRIPLSDETTPLLQSVNRTAIESGVDDSLKELVFDSKNMSRSEIAGKIAEIVNSKIKYSTTAMDFKNGQFKFYPRYNRIGFWKYEQMNGAYKDTFETIKKLQYSEAAKNAKNFNELNQIIARQALETGYGNCTESAAACVVLNNALEQSRIEELEVKRLIGVDHVVALSRSPDFLLIDAWLNPPVVFHDEVMATYYYRNAFSKAAYSDDISIP